MTLAANSPTPGHPRGGRTVNPIHNAWAVLAILFLGAGALGLPILWMSRAFSRPMKIVLSIVVLLYTAAMLAIIVLVCVWFWQGISPLFSGEMR